MIAALLWTVAACGGGGDALPDRLADCSDAPCRAAWIDARWAENQDEVEAVIKTLEDPVERLVLVQGLAEAHPGKTGSLCELLPAGPDQKRCTTLNERPHLWQIDITTPTEGQMSSGRVFSAVAPEKPLQSPWDEDQPLAVPCPGGQLLNGCQSAAALDKARTGLYRDAGRACQAIEEDKWRFECFFQASEHAWRGGAGSPLEATRLCMGAGPFQPRCFGHLAMAMSLTAPASQDPSPEAWAVVMRSARESRLALQPVDPMLSERLSGRIWAQSLWRAYIEAPVVSGDPKDRIEPLAEPHLRAAVAARLWALERAEPRTLEQWVERVEAAVAAREPDPAATAPSGEMGQVRNLWAKVLPGEETYAWVSYLGDARRAHAKDARIDAAICVLEAAAREGDLPLPLFEEALGHPETVVRWTAARLVSGVASGSRLNRLSAADEDPTVRARTGYTGP